MLLKEYTTAYNNVRAVQFGAALPSLHVKIYDDYTTSGLQAIEKTDNALKRLYISIAMFNTG